MGIQVICNIFFLKNYKYFLKKGTNVSALKIRRSIYYNMLRFSMTYVHSSNFRYISKVLLVTGCNTYLFNSLIFLNLKKFESFFYNFSQKNNFLVLDSNYGSTFNLYADMFSKKNMYSYKQLFFIKPKYMTFRNWNFYFFKMSKNNNVGLVIVTDYIYFKNFISNFYKYNIILCLLQPVDYHLVRSDYYLYSHSNFLSVHKFFYIQYINSLYYSSKISKNLNFNKNYFYFFKKFLKFI